MIYRLAHGVPLEVSYGLALADACRAHGFHAGMRITGSRKVKVTRYVTVPHAGGTAMIRVSDHKRPRGALEAHGPLLLDVSTDWNLEDAISGLERVLNGLSRGEGGKDAIRLPAWFCGRVEGGNPNG